MKVCYEFDWRVGRNRYSNGGWQASPAQAAASAGRVRNDLSAQRRRVLRLPL